MDYEAWETCKSILKDGTYLDLDLPTLFGSIFYKEKIKSVILKVTRYLITLNNHEYLQCTNGIVLLIKRMSPFSDEY